MNNLSFVLLGSLYLYPLSVYKVFKAFNYFLINERMCYELMMY